MNAFVFIHVAISLVGILSGFVVLFGLLAGKGLNSWTAVTTVATSVTGFLLPAEHLMPSHVIGVLSLIALALAIYGRYARRLTGGWRKTYVIGAVAALYFNVFVGVVQAFMKVPTLKVLAPTQSEPPFAATQFVVLVLFIALGVIAAIRFYKKPVVLAY